MIILIIVINEKNTGKAYVLMEGSFFEIYGLMDSDGVVSGNDMDALEK